VTVVFSNFKSGLKRLVDSIGNRELSLKDLEKHRDDILIFLIENDVAYDAAEGLMEGFLKYVLGMKVSRFSSPSEAIYMYLRDYISKVLKPLEDDFDRIVLESVSREPPYKMLFVGVNGTGKTTSLAKTASRLKKIGLTPLLVCSDTFRAGAIEQLNKHANNLKLPFFATGYGHDPAAVAYDAINHAESRGYEVVLIDTAGRQYSNKNLMDELRKVKRVVNPNSTILVLDSLTGADVIKQAEEFDTGIGVDRYVFTKVDADIKGGAIISASIMHPKKISFLGVGQRYEDLLPFKAEYIIQQMF